MRHRIVYATRLCDVDSLCFDVSCVSVCVFGLLV